jgi:predicted Zn-dependent peptidase
MHKREIKGLDLFLYEETLENGLRVFIVPKENKEGLYVTFTTKFGGRDIEFIPNGESSFLQVSPGIAHFLEHKMFEQESGIDVMSEFSKNGVSSNANTSLYKTTYLFDGVTHFKENLNLLLNYVQEPYFTEENVEKEKHIIEQEIDMYADNPYQASYDKLFKNLFVNDPVRIPTIGSKESVRNITKEELYQCYNTFYHPSNMFLTITGNVDPKEAIKIVKQNQAKKHFGTFHKPVLKEYEEPVCVSKEKDSLCMNITVPKVSLGFKFDLDLLKEKLGMDEVTIRRYLAIYANLKFGGVSLFLKKAKEDQVITSSLDYSIFSTDHRIVLILEGDTKNEKELLKRIQKEIKEKEIEESMFLLKQKSMVASCIYMSENIYSLNQKIMGDIIDRDTIELDVLDQFKALNYQDFIKLVACLDFTNFSVVTVNSNKKIEENYQS